jgi:hypothetical protein
LNRFFSNQLNLFTLFFLFAQLFLITCFNPSNNQEKQAINPPYPQSVYIKELVFNWSSHVRLAQGSDNWPVTWADDDHQYTSWGDGGGFEGNIIDGHVSLGVARIEGLGHNYRGKNIWGGKKSENSATFEGKSYGILSLDDILYMWVSPGSGAMGYKESRLCRSDDYGASWNRARWSFDEKDKILNPAFLQYGKNYQGSRDNYVYVYAINIKDSRKLKVQKPGEIVLLRVDRRRLMDKGAYEFFAGYDAAGNPIWVKDLRQRKPVFKNKNGVGWNCSVSFNKGLNCYLLITEHTVSFKGNFCIFDGPEPWGPWTTVAYLKSFGAPAINSNTFYWNFSNRWLSEDGRKFVLIFTGINENDSWNTVEGKFILSPKVSMQDANLK